MMKAKSELTDLISLLKVFDANYVSDEDCMKLQGLDGNKPEDVAKAVNSLLISELRTYPESVQLRLINLLRISVADSKEDFGALFDRIELAFDGEVIDKRAFMSALLAGIEAGLGQR